MHRKATQTVQNVQPRDDLIKTPRDNLIKTSFAFLRTKINQQNFWTDARDPIHREGKKITQ